MQINKVNSACTFGMPVAKDFRKIWNKPAGVIGESCEEILSRLDKTTTLHFITRPRRLLENSGWVAAPRVGSKARKVAANEDFWHPTQYDSLVKLDELLHDEYARLGKKKLK